VGVNQVFKNVDGVDVSHPNNVAAGEYVKHNLGDVQPNLNTRIFDTNGYDLSEIWDESYDFVMSTIVFQHICVHRIRYNLMEEIFRILKPGGMFTVQMGFGVDKANSCGYFENRNDIRTTNGGFDTRVENPEDLIGDLEKIGFKVPRNASGIGHVITPPYFDNHSRWIWVKAFKP
jgi:SAM-dependent methyltransferase